MNQSVTVNMSQYGYKGFLNTYIVRGVGKRAVTVVFRPFDTAKLSYQDERQMAVEAAQYAVKKGWRVVVIMPDDYYGNDARMFNWHEFMVENETKGYQGKFLRRVGNNQDFL